MTNGESFIKVCNRSGRIIEMTVEDYANYGKRMGMKIIHNRTDLKFSKPVDAKVEIIIVRFNNPEIEDKCIDLVKKHTDNYKLTVYDNYKKNEGLSTVWNRLIKKSDCDYICLLNSDAFVTPGWLEELMKGFRGEKVVAVSPSSNNAKGRQGGHSEAGEEGTFEEMDTLSGFCMVIKKGIEFPEEVPFYGGEHAWCIKAKRKGYKLLWAKGCWVEHLGEASAKKEGNFDELWGQRDEQFYTWLASTTPVLYTTYNRLDYTKETLPKLMRSVTGKIIVVDNGSTDGTVEWLEKRQSKKLEIIYNKNNEGIKGAMNTLFEKTKTEFFVAKVDNDTVVERDWLVKLLMLADKNEVDVIQAKHPFVEGTFTDHYKRLKKLNGIGIADIVGGSGVVIRRKKINGGLEDSKRSVLYSWCEFQRKHPEMIRAFTDKVEIKLLDMEEDGKTNYDKYKDYYSETGRLNNNARPMKLNIGSGHKPLPGYVNMDIHDYEADGFKTDVIRDISRGIPFDSEKFEEVYTSHFMEHVRNGEELYFVLGEIYRVLQPGGRFIIRVPHSDTPYAFYPDHLSFWNEEVVKAMCSDPFQHSKHHSYNFEVETLGRQGIELQAVLVKK